jgi:hypothetical protein
MKKPSVPWWSDELRGLAAAARHPELRKAITEYDRLRGNGIPHNEAVIEAARLAGLDVSRLHDLSWWKN